MRLTYLVANAAYVFTFGQSLVPMDDEWFHETRHDAVRRAGLAGLAVSPAGVVSVA